MTTSHHQQPKALAAPRGKSIKDNVLERTLPVVHQAADVKKLEDFLKPRLEAAKRSEWSEQTAGEIVAETLLESRNA